MKAEGSEKSNCLVCCDARLDAIVDIYRNGEKNIEEVDSVVDQLDEKVDTIDSKVDVINDNVSDLLLDLDSIDSKIDVLDEKVDTVDSKMDDLIRQVETIDSIVDEIKIDTAFNISINSKVDILDEKSDTIDSKLDVMNVELVSIESKLDTWIGPLVETIDGKIDTIESKVDEVQADVAPINSKLDVLDEKIDTVDSKLDDLENKVVTIDSLVDIIEIESDANDTINSKVDVLDEKIDTVDSKLDVVNIELVSIESKLDNWVGPLVETMDSKTDIIDSKLDQVGSLVETIDSKIDLLDSGATILTSGETITNPGVYILIEQIDCPITVAADNVRIDLRGFDICGTCTAIVVNPGINNVVIKNGSLVGAAGCTYSCDQGALVAASGIAVHAGAQLVTIEDMTIFGYDKGVSFIGTSTQEIKSCGVKNCVVECCNTGYDLRYVIKTEFDNCRALNCYYSGFYQENCQYNLYRNSDAVKIENSDTTNRAIGFASIDGLGNLYDGCLAEGVATGTGTLSLGPVGFLFEGDETESKILNSIANSTNAQAGAAIAYGIKLSGVFEPFNLLFDLDEVSGSFGHSDIVYSVAWSPARDYLAIGGSQDVDGVNVRIFAFDGTSLSEILTATFDNGNDLDIDSVDWHPSGQYLAIGGEEGATGNTVTVFAFDGTYLSVVDVYDYDGDIRSVKWDPTGAYLAIAGVYSISLSGNVSVLSFDGSSLSAPLDTFNHSGAVNSVDWYPTGAYLAIGSQQSVQEEIRVISFDGASFSALPGASFEHGADIEVVAWNPTGEYLTAGGKFSSVGNYELRFFSFDGTTLTLEDSYADYGINRTIFGIDWSPNGQYFAIGGLPGTNGGLEILEFDGSNILSLGSSVICASCANISVQSVDWSPIDNFIAVGGEELYGIDVRVYDFSSENTANIQTYSHGADINSVDWSHDVNYLAIGGDTGTGGDELRILSFDGNSLSTLETATVVLGETVNALSWRPGDRFLAAGSKTATDGYNTRVFGFDGLVLKNISGARADHGDTVNSVDFSLSGEHLAIGGESGTGGYEVRVYTFDGAYLDEISGANYDHGARVNSVAWAPHPSSLRNSGGTSSGQAGGYLAIGGVGGTGGYELRVLGFNYTSLYDISGAVYAFDETTDFVNQIAWSPNQNYLAIAVGSNTLPGTSRLRVLVLEFDSNTLTPVAEYESTSEANSVSWSPNSEYITVGLDTDEVLVLSFNGYTLAQESSYDHGAIVQSVDWSQHGKNIAIGGRNGTGGFDVRTFNVMTYPTKNLIDNNKVCNTSSQVGVQNAVGISGASGTNAIVRNTSYDNDLNFSAGVTQLYDATNDCCNDSTSNIPLPTKNQVCFDPQANVFILSTIDSKVDVVDDKVDLANIELGSIESKLDQWIGPLDETIDSKVDVARIESVSIESKLDQWIGPLNEIIDSKVDILLLYKGETPVSCPWTIDESGLYSISENKNCCVVIDADHVTLDLNDFTLSCTTANAVVEILPGHTNIEIKNGTIKGASDLTNDGILTGSNSQLISIENIKIYSCDIGMRFAGTSSNIIKDCTIKNCLIQGCNIGADLDYTIKTIFENCAALNCVNAGFYQENSSYNVYQNSQVLSTQNTSTSERALGFASVDGTGNLFTSCIAEGISTTTGTLAYGAIGFLLEGDETESKIINCVANSSEVLDDTGIAYGMKLSGVLTTSSVTSYEHGALIVHSVDWSPDANYLAIGVRSGSGGDVDVRVLGWDGVSLSDIVTAALDLNMIVESINWSPNGQYLAVGGITTGDDEVRVFSFNGLLLDEVSSYAYGDDVYSVVWSPNGEYLAIQGDAVSDGLRVLSFENETLSLIPGAVSGDKERLGSIDWSPDGKLLAVSFANYVKVLRFDGKILSEVDSYDHGARVYAAAWSQNQDYIAIGGWGGTGGYELRVLRFDGTSLYDIPGAVYDSQYVNSISWSPNGQYLVIGTRDTDSTGEVCVFSFDGYSLTQLSDSEYNHGQDIESVVWSQNGKYIAAGGEPGTGGYDVRVFYDVMDYPSKCLIDSNKVCNAIGQVNAGIGIAGSGGTNTIVRNIACENNTNLGTGIYNFTKGLSAQAKEFDNLSVPPY